MIEGLKKIAKEFGDTLGDNERERAVAYAGFLCGAGVTLTAIADYCDAAGFMDVAQDIRKVKEREFTK